MRGLAARSLCRYAHRLATRTIEYMTYAKNSGKHFFIGVGIRKPHSSPLH